MMQMKVINTADNLQPGWLARHNHTNTDLPPRGRGSDLFDGCVSVELHSATAFQVLSDGFWKRFHSPFQGPLGPRLLEWPPSQRASGDHRLGACRLEHFQNRMTYVSMFGERDMYVKHYILDIYGCRHIYWTWWLNKSVPESSSIPSMREPLRCSTL